MTPIETRIEDVTVYTDRARVTRRGRSSLPAGEVELVVEDLPAVLLSESVRAAARATAPARLIATDVERTFHSEPPEARVADLQAEVERLQEQDEAAGRKAEALAVRRTFLQTLAASAGEQLARGIAFGRTAVETGATVSTFLGEQLAGIDTETLEVERERKEVRKALAAARSRLDALQRRTPTERRRAKVLLHLEGAADVDLELTYQVENASWQPLYDIRLTEAGAAPALAITYLAEVTQHTGEVWEAVNLSLSTAKPALSAILPELQPWYLMPEPPAFPVAAGGAGADMMRMRAVAAPAAAAPPVEEDYEAMAEPAPFFEAVQETATVQDTGASVTFNVSGRTGIPDDGSPHKVTLGSHDLPVRLDYVTAPKLVTQAYRRARVVHGGTSVLLPGPASIFHEGEFVGATRLKTVAPGQEFELFLGVDDRIRVERKLVEGSVDKRFLGNTRRMNYAYEIRVTNLKERRETVTVLDQVPVPRHEAVKVRMGEVRPAPAEQTELGRLKWELALDPGREVLLRFAFTIESPREMRLINLPPLQEG